MLAIKGQISQNIARIIKNINSQAELDEAAILGMLEYPPDEKMGDIALPCFKLSRTLRTAPIKIAEAIAAELKDCAIKRVEAVNGYLNIYLDGECLAKKVISEVQKKGDKYASISQMACVACRLSNWPQPSLKGTHRARDVVL